MTMGSIAKIEGMRDSAVNASDVVENFMLQKDILFRGTKIVLKILPFFSRENKGRRN